MAVSLTNMPNADKAAARSATDIREYEAIPITERIAENSIYDLVCNAAEAWGETAFMKFLPHGLADDEPKALSFARLRSDVTQAANALRQLGLKRNEAIGFLAPNLPQTFVCQLAAATAGRANPVNPLLSVEHIVTIMRAARVRIIATVSPAADNEIFAKAQAIAAALGEGVDMLVLDAPCEGATFLGELMAQCHYDQLVGFNSPSSNDIAGIFHTGGTTSAPKLISMTHRNQLATTCMGLLGSGYRPGDVSLAGLPTYHVIGGIATPLVSLAGGVTILLCGPSGFRNPFMIGDFWKIVARHGVTTAAIVPTILSVLKDLPITENISSLRQIVSGAAPLPTALIEAIGTKTDAEIVETYGMTEASTFCARNPVGGEKRPGSVGPFVPYQEYRLVEDGAEENKPEVAQGEVGRILVRGPNIVGSTAFADECGNAIGEERVDENGWLDTGDLGRIDADGYVWLQGRAKDLIIRSGHNIDPGLIEEALSAHPSVNMVAAVGQPDGYAGEVPVAFVTLQGGAATDEEALLAYAREHVSERPAAPARIEMLDALPLTAIGKVYKPQLRTRAAEYATRMAIEGMIASDVSVEIQAEEAAPGARRPVKISVGGADGSDFIGFVAKAEPILLALNLDPTFLRSA
ncbi:MAG: acyl-CoA synthetase [Parasphingorhabdus sp.]